MEKIKVLYFTAVSLGSTGDGGSLCCRNHVRRLADDASIELTVVVTGPAAWEDSNRSYVTSLGAEFAFLRWNERPLCPSLRDRLRVLSLRDRLRVLSRRYALVNESNARLHRYVDFDFAALVNQRAPDIVVVDYLPSVHYVMSLFRLATPRCMITLNRETDYLREIWARKTPPGSRLDVCMATLRAVRFDRWLYPRLNGFVALTENDMPASLPTSVARTVISPFLDPTENVWAYARQHSIFFVGNIAHYPNRLAVEWICTRLSPEVENLNSKIRFRVIGAEVNQVPHYWRRRSIDFLGRSDSREVERHFTSADLFIAPIANKYGSKMKLLECVAYGTPFVATRQAMSGLPFIAGVPEIDLDRPAEAARALVDLLDEPARLFALSASIRRQLECFRESQAGVWGRFLRTALASEAAKRGDTKRTAAQ